MRQLVILSGKGGTGKTIVAAALAHLGSAETSLVLADADVDASNLELILNPVLRERRDFVSGHSAAIDPDACTDCGICLDVCRFDAIVEDSTGYRVDTIACEGCASCFYQCPDEAITMVPQPAQWWIRSDTRFGPLLHARLPAGQENSGKLVTRIREESRLIGGEEERELILIDGPPGIGCPTIAASVGTDLALLVTEPTISADHDLQRIIATLDHFHIPAVALINKADVNPEQAEAMAVNCRNHGIDVMGKLPFDTGVTQAMVDGRPVTEYLPESEVAHALQGVWERVEARL